MHLTMEISNKLLQLWKVPAEECVDIGQVDANFAKSIGFQSQICPQV